MKKLFLALMTVSFVVAQSFGAFSSASVGTTGAQFLKIGVGARAVAMGEAQAAIANDVNALYWNPAGLNYMQGREGSLMHCSWFDDIAYDNISYGQKSEKLDGFIAGGVSYLSMSPMTKYDNLGNKLNETFSAYDALLTIGYARKIYDIPFGASIKCISSQLENEKSTAFAFDLGVRYDELMESKLSLGAAVQNIGTKVKFINQEDPLPFNVKLGAGYKIPIKGNPVLVALDLNFPIDNDPYVGLGGEYVYSFSGDFRLVPRLGYKSGAKGLEGLSGITGGIGFGYKQYSIDYAMAPYGDLGQTNRISINVAFDAPKK
ncbi:MAG: PorV/PorQ family protein [Endomicrobiales bacterium]|nr:PorV/PorQ family protein [Endomicrobiales bacterium]